MALGCAVCHLSQKPKMFLHLHSRWTLLSSLWENVLPFQLFLRPVSEPDPSCVSFTRPGKSSAKKKKKKRMSLRMKSGDVFTPTIVHQNKSYIMVIDGFFIFLNLPGFYFFHSPAKDGVTPIVSRLLHPVNCSSGPITLILWWVQHHLISREEVGKIGGIRKNGDLMDRKTTGSGGGLRPGTVCVSS